ncbi:Class III cytochrome C family protein [Planctomycetes bacterium Pla163]|uniref:Class III cytochrome C family protein n=1 Tax=Rohdeia mirabilis TaxID=2528008 RepID=A0A518CVP8_9BACT|nr:Class III cytochrome C family protein [Planctomycetes bacterium Pla163]
MKVADPRVLLSIASLALVVMLVVIDLGRTSPGPLSSTHAAVAELVGQDGCVQCHGSGGVTLVQACLSCHTAIEEQLADGHGFHGALDAEIARACASCHVEHHGDDVPLSGAMAFARAGVPEIDGFDHGHTQFGLEGAHDELRCAECHANADAVTLKKGEPRFLGAEQACATCHEDPHEGTYSESCATCHGQEHPFAAVASFAHGDAFPLVGAHGRPGCSDCHPLEGVHSIATLANLGRPETERACSDCHENPHTSDFVATTAALASLRVENACVLCHDAVHDSFTVGATIDEPQHAATGFALDAPHAGLDCAACHQDAAVATFAERFPGRSRSDCASCHEDPHVGQFDPGGPSAFAGASCVDCHTLDAFHPHAFDTEQHGSTTFPLTGAHVAADCAGCHVPEHPELLDESTLGAVNFASAESTCAACHADAHEGGLAFLENAGGCAECHTTTAFDDVDRETFDHGRAHFALTGAHAALDCAKCHTEASEPDAFGRTFGRVAEAPQGHAACSGCHDDVHAGRFEEVAALLDAYDRSDVPAIERPVLDGALAAIDHHADGRIGCARCHGTDDFAAVDRKVFEHGAWTGFALDGAHDAISCESCHGPGAATGRRFGFAHERWSGPLDACATCHTDPHLGAFDRTGPADVDGRVGCARCHTTSGFVGGVRERFDHDRWTEFALTDSHAAADCAACHTLPRADATGMHLGLAQGTSCADCHTDPHLGQFDVNGRTDCASCHAAPTTFADLRFDHDVDTRFPLDAQHAALDCAACHRANPLPGGGEVVRYKPLGTACVDCHGLGFEEEQR